MSEGRAEATAQATKWSKILAVEARFALDGKTASLRERHVR